MAEAEKCPTCGNELHGDAPGGHCIRCLAELALTTGGEETIVAESAIRIDSPSGPSLAEKPGDRIGRYKILQQIGEGGCGVVYLADQSEPVRRRVALKVIKPGMDSRQVLTRFEAERQALALMDHPNIAKVLDAGATEAGRPYFVMELVLGIPITRYCDERQLNTQDRLELFVQVCQAIQHAHQKGVIHRDIKPSNVLVVDHDGAPAPQIIDFGIAKAITDQRLTDKTLFTAFEQFMGTPAYMSPEQASLSGLDIDTRSDIYSLGVLLYELLIGRPPFEPERLRRAALDEICRIIREEEPSRPSARLTTLTQSELGEIAAHRHVAPLRLAGELRGDLDWLVMKALEKDRTRRYATANAFAADIQRHLQNEPIAARPPSALYRLKKFARRNRTAVAAIAAVSLALIAGTVISTTEAVHARRAEALARKEAATSGRIKEFLEQMINGNTPGRFLERDTTVLHEMLEQASQRVELELHDQPEVAAELLHVIGNNYRALGKFAEAEAAYRRALPFATRFSTPDAEPHASILEGIAVAARRLGRVNEAEQLCRDALALRRLAPRSSPDDITGSLANVMLSLILRNRGVLDEAERLAHECVEARRHVFGATNQTVADAINDWGKTLEFRGDFSAAEAAYREALAISVATAKNEDAMTVSKEYCNIGIVLYKRGNLDEAAAYLRRAADIDQRIYKSGHADAMHALATLAQLEFQRGHTNEAEELFQEATTNDTAAHPQWPAMLSSVLQRHAFFRRQIGDNGGADALGIRAAQVLLAARADASVEVIEVLGHAAQVFSLVGDFTNAEARAQLAIQVAAAGTERVPHVWAYAQQHLSELRRQQGRIAEAEAIDAGIKKLLGNAATACERGDVEPSDGLINSLADLAGNQEKDGDLAGAEENYRRAVALAHRLTYANKYILHAFDSYATFLAAQNRSTEAAVVMAEAEKLRSGRVFK